MAASGLHPELVAGGGSAEEQDDAEEARVAVIDVAKELVLDAPTVGPLLVRQLADALADALAAAVAAAGGVSGGMTGLVGMEAALYAASMIGRPALAGLPHGEAAASSAAVEAARLVAMLPAVVAVAGQAAPLVRRTAVVLIGTMAPALAGGGAALEGAVPMVYDSLVLPHASMRAWGRGEDHVGAVALWRLGAGCAAALCPAFEQLADRAAEPEVRAAMAAAGWASHCRCQYCTPASPRGLSKVVSAFQSGCREACSAV